MIVSKKIFFPLALILSFVLASCASTSDGHSHATATSERQLKVYASTGYLADAISNLHPGAVIHTMVGPGGDPHTYQPTTKDIETIRNSDVIVSGGLNLEPHMKDLFDQQGEKHMAVGDQLDKSKLLDWPEKDHHGNPLKDPHIWNSPFLWLDVVDSLVSHLSKLNPQKKDDYIKNGNAYKKEISDTHNSVVKKFESIPKNNRYLISGHDAFNYLGKVYGFKVRATDFVSTEAQLSASDLNDLAKDIAAHKVPTIFLDNQANPQAIKSLQEAVQHFGWNVKISDDKLYADTLGEGPDVNTYLGVLKHNADAIVKALAPKH